MADTPRVDHYRLEMHEQHEGPQTIFAVEPRISNELQPAASDFYVQQADRVVAVMEDGIEYTIKNRHGDVDPWPPTPEEAKIDTKNDWMLAVRGDAYQILHFPVGPFDAETGLRMAAWLRALCEHQAPFTFDEIYEAVRNT